MSGRTGQRQTVVSDGVWIIVESMALLMISKIILNQSEREDLMVL